MSYFYLSALAYGYDFVLLTQYFSGCLGRRHSKKATYVSTFVCWLFFLVFKLIPMYRLQYHTAWILAFQTLLMGGWILIFFGKSLTKKLLVVMLNLATLGILEVATIQLLLTTMRPDTAALTPGTDFTAMGTILMIPLTFFGVIADYWLWKRFERRQWKLMRSELRWICLILPIGQSLLLCGYAERYLMVLHQIDPKLVAGVILSILANVGTFYLIEGVEEQKKLASEVMIQKRLHRSEKIRYEQLHQDQEDMAKLRHDYQNYLMMLQGLKEEQDS